MAFQLPSESPGRRPHEWFGAARPAPPPTGRGLPGRGSLFVPALVFGAWTAAGASAIARHFGKHKERYRIGGAIAPVGTIFVPVFFVYMGLQVDLRSFASPDVLLFAAVLSVVAIASKQVCSLGVFEKGVNRWAVGLGMVPRGEVGLIFAGVGATAMVAGTPVFDGETFAAIVAMVMVTTLATPPLLRAAFPRATGGGRGATGAVR